MTKKILSAVLALVMLFSFMLPVLAHEHEHEDENATESTSVQAEEKEEEKTEEKEEAAEEGFTYLDAEKAALAAAKSKFIIEGLSNEEASSALVTKVSYDDEEEKYSVTVRAGNKHKYTCTVSVGRLLDKELGFVGNGEYVQQNVVWGFICKQFEKLSYFFFRKGQE